MIDAHQHFWDPRPGRSPAIPADHPLFRTFSPEHLQPELDACGVDFTVVVQAADAQWETDELLDLAARTPFLSGVVGWLPLQDPEATQAAITRYRGSSLCGVRHLLHLEPDQQWLRRQDVVESLRLLGAAGLAFDVVAVRPALLEELLEVAPAVPQTRFVLDHLGKPPIREKGWQPWSDLVARVAEHENVFAKISGLTTAADPENWSPDDLLPYVEHAVEHFGSKRLLWGSDWPVSLQAGDYSRHYAAVLESLRELAPADREAVMGRTAAAVYGLNTETSRL